MHISLHQSSLPQCVHLSPARQHALQIRWRRPTKPRRSCAHTLTMAQFVAGATLARALNICGTPTRATPHTQPTRKARQAVAVPTCQQYRQALNSLASMLPPLFASRYKPYWPYTDPTKPEWRPSVRPTDIRRTNASATVHTFAHDNKPLRPLATEAAASSLDAAHVYASHCTPMHWGYSGVAHTRPLLNSHTAGLHCAQLCTNTLQLLRHQPPGPDRAVTTRAGAHAGGMKPPRRASCVCCLHCPQVKCF